MESDNYLARHGCLDLFNLDIVAVVDTHLSDKDDLLFNDFQWYGHNRTDIHRKAKKCSGGVALSNVFVWMTQKRAFYGSNCLLMNVILPCVFVPCIYHQRAPTVM